jgi:ABC-type antimicrobial peptide transport system permease subunit
VVPDVITRVSVLEPLVMYFPMAQEDVIPSRTVVVRAVADMPAAIRETIALVKQMEPTLVPTPFLKMDEWISRQMGPQKFGVTVLGALGFIAMLLTVLGTYVLAESMASARRREMGIRAALGASRGQLGRLVLSQTARLVGLGLGVGLGVSWLLASLIRAFLFQVEPFDLVTLGVVSGTILALALAVSLKPAAFAARVNLARVLREE